MSRRTRSRYSSPDRAEAHGTITEVMPERHYRVMTDQGTQVLATLSARARRERLRVERGDGVLVLVSPYDMGRGRIVALRGSPRHPPAA